MSDYVQDLTASLEAAKQRVTSGRQVKALKDNAPALFEVIDTEVSLALTRMTGDTPLTYEEYLSAHGEVKMAKRIRGLLNSKEAEAAAAAEQVVTKKAQLKALNDGSA